jgi:hypothetical protein
MGHNEVGGPETSNREIRSPDARAFEERDAPSSPGIGEVQLLRLDVVVVESKISPAGLPDPP